MKHDAIVIVDTQPQFPGQVPGNGFPFPVRVACQIDILALLCQFPEFLDSFLLLLRNPVRGLEVMFHIHAKAVLAGCGQVTDVAFGRNHFVAASEVFFYCFRFGG